MWTKQWRRRWPLRRVVLPLVTIGVCGYFAHHATSGPNGWEARGERLAQRARLTEEVAALTFERERMARRTRLLGGTVIERDVLDERARSLLGLTREDEIVVMLRADRG